MERQRAQQRGGQPQRGQGGRRAVPGSDPLWILPRMALREQGLLARALVYAWQLRALRRILALALVELALLLALGQGSGQAATIVVGGTCTLADAINAANTDSAAGSCPAGSGADTIVLHGDFTLAAVDNTTYGPTGLPVVTSQITIQGNTHTVQRDGAAPAFRLLAVDASGDLTVQQLTLQGGLSTAEDGGGALFNQGTLTVSRSTLSGNAASIGGGVSNSPAGKLTLSQSTLSGNAAVNSGGGVYSSGSNSLALTQSTLTGNAASAGGGVFTSLGTVTLRLA